MSESWNRRQFVTRSVAGGLATLSGSRLIAGLAAVPDEQLPAPGRIVRLQPDIEPLVRLLEETPRQKLLEEVGSRIKKG